MTNVEWAWRQAKSRAAACLLQYLDCPNRCEECANELLAATRVLEVAAMLRRVPSQQSRAMALVEREVA